MVFLAIFIALVLLIIITMFSRLSLMVEISFDSEGFQMEIKVMLYRILKLFSWNFKEGGLDFFLKKKKQVPKDKKKKKGRISAILNLIFSKDTYNHLKKKNGGIHFFCKRSPVHKGCCFNCTALREHLECYRVTNTFHPTKKPGFGILS